MLYVADIKMNLMSGSLLSKRNIFKLVFQSDKFILFKNRMFIREGYLSDDLFKINILTIVTMNNKKENYNKFSSYLLKSCDVWYNR